MNCLKLPDTNLLPFNEDLDGGQQFDVEKIVVHPKFNPSLNMFLYIFFQQKFVLRGGSVLNELPEVPNTNLLPFDENLDGRQQFDVEKIVVHPKFNPFTYEHDIALITLKNSIRPSKELFPVCLPEPKMNNEITDYSGKDYSGYGRNTSPNLIL
jgi:hypothetical protein